MNLIEVQKLQIPTQPSQVVKDSKIVTEKNIFKLYSIKKYNKANDIFKQSGHTIVTLYELEEKISKNNNYHFNVLPTKNYIFFGDCDYYRENNVESFLNLLIVFLKTSYDISITIADISHTINKSKLGSYHYSIPSLYCSCTKLKEIHLNFLNEHKSIFHYKNEQNEDIKVVDTKIYRDGWFRYPNQTKESIKGTEHSITKGLIRDFIVEYISTNSICIDNKEYIIKSDNISQYINNTNYNFVSYGIRTGKFKLDIPKLLSISNFKYYIENYTFTEKKTKFYKLMFDIDFKNDTSKNILDISSDILSFICINIVTILNKLFDNPNTNFIYCDKNIGQGVHLYFPDIIVDSKIHVIIRNLLLIICKQEDKYKFVSDTLWDNIIDASVTVGLSIRLCYYHKDCSYYQPNWLLSTYCQIDSKISVLQTCLINTNATAYNHLQTDYVINLLEDMTYHKQNSEIVTTESDIDFMKDLLDILSIKRLDGYTTWIAVVFLSRVYDLKDSVIKVSQKSHKYDSKSLDKIESIWAQPISDQHYTMNTLIMWAMEDNSYDTMIIHRKYGKEVYIPLLNDIALLDKIFLHGVTIEPNYIEATKYISDNAFDDICQAVQNNTKFIILDAPTGGGKTTTITKFIDYIIKNICITTLQDIGLLSVVSRQSMCSTHQKAFEKYEMISYLDSNRQFQNVFIASVESLLYYKDTDPIYNIVILDEINSLVGYIYSPTLNGKRRQCYVALCNIINNATYVICCDANITSLVFNLVLGRKTSSEKIYYYKNKATNKQDVIMNIYSYKQVESTKETWIACDYIYKKIVNKTTGIISYKKKKNNINKISRNDIIAEYCKFVEADVTAGKDIIMFVDSRRIALLVAQICNDYIKKNNIIRDDYVVMMDRYGSLSDITDCNNTFKNKYVICTPKIIYGCDILIKYHHMFCIYSHTGRVKGMDGLQYHQQYSRPRNCKIVNILILDGLYGKSVNKFITYEENMEIEKRLYEEHMMAYNDLSDKYKVVNELMGVDECNLFMDIHYHKTWYDYLFCNDKTQLFKMMAKRAGYTIIDCNLIVSGKVGKEITGCIKQDKQTIKTITKNIIEEISNSNQNKNIVNITEQKLKIRITYLNKVGVNDITKEIETFIIDDKKFKGFVNKQYLDMDKETFDKTCIKMCNNDIPIVGKKNSLAGKINGLFWLEGLLGIKRYDINGIKKDIVLEDVKSSLEKDIRKLYHLFGEERSKSYANKRIKGLIDDINSYNRLQKFVADAYNCFGNIVFYTKKKGNNIINNTRIQTCTYNEFKIIENIIKDNNDDTHDNDIRLFR